MRSLSLGRDDDFDAFVIDLFQFIGSGVSGISAGCFTIFTKRVLGFRDLFGELVQIVVLADRVGMDDKAVFFIDDGLDIVTGMRTMNAVDARAFGIGGV